MIRKGLILCLMLCQGLLQAQVNWLGFHQLDSVLAVESRPVFIDFYTDWCTYCKKMDQEVFTDAEVITELNKEFYAVRFNAETEEDTLFDGLTWQKSSNQTIHSLAQLFNEKGTVFSPPLLVVLDEKFTIKERINAYQSRKKLLKMLRKYSGS